MNFLVDFVIIAAASCVGGMIADAFSSPNQGARFPQEEARRKREAAARDAREAAMSLEELEEARSEASLGRSPYYAEHYPGGAVRAHHDYERLTRLVWARKAAGN